MDADRDWYTPTPALLAAIRAAYDAEAMAAVPVTPDRLHARLCGDVPRQMLELVLAFGAVPGLELQPGPWGEWVVVVKES